MRKKQKKKEKEQRKKEAEARGEVQRFRFPLNGTKVVYTGLEKAAFDFRGQKSPNGRASIGRSPGY